MKTLFILFWATGDLAKRKIYWALYDLFKDWKSIDIIWIWRKNFQENQFFQEYVNQETDLFIKKDKSFFEYLKTISYVQVEIDKKETYLNLENKIKKYKTDNIIIYLSIWYELFPVFIENIKECSALLKKEPKIIFEKPFWKDLQSAEILNDSINKLFDEKQIYRIDHYVWKEPIQNILSLRFSNILFEPIWNSNYIDNIQIIATEKIWIWDRWEYYDKSWALRDMVQNHLFQVLTLITMEPPLDMSEESIASEKLKILKELKVDKNNLVFWQYDGYKNEKNVSKDSITETFVSMKLKVDSWRFKDLPIYLKTGKYLNEKNTKIIIEFKEIPNIFLKKYWEIEKNRIIIEIQPEEKIQIQFNLKKKNNHTGIETILSEFSNEDIQDMSYKNLINDCIKWNKFLFINWNILKQSWLLVDDIINCKNDCPIIKYYEKNTRGPIESDYLIEQDWRKWFI